MPEINVDYFRAIADESHGPDAIVHISGGAGNAAVDPTIIFIDGTVMLPGGYSGCGMTVATQGIELAGDTVYDEAKGVKETGWAFLSTGYFKLNGKARIHGGIYCHNAVGTAEFTAAGTPNTQGTVVSDLVSVRGDYVIKFDGSHTVISELPGTARALRAPVVTRLFWEEV